MNREELRRYIGVTGYSLGQVEKDYFQHIILSALSRKSAGLLVFKGGTALQKIGIIPRFSEDLDFTARADVSLEQIRDIAMSAIKNYNFPVESDRFVNDGRTTSFRLKIQGPLYQNRLGICTVRLKISTRESVINEPIRKEFAPLYSDILPYVLDVMLTEEMLAEKIRAIYTRNKARDLYDIYKMLERKTKLDRYLANKKLTYYRLSFDTSVFIKRCERLQPHWNNELQSLIETVVPYQKALDAVKKAVKDIN